MSFSLLAIPEHPVLSGEVAHEAHTVERDGEVEAVLQAHKGGQGKGQGEGRRLGGVVGGEGRWGGCRGTPGLLELWGD